MRNESYRVTIALDNAAKDVFNHIIDVSKWWSKDFDGNSTKLNDEFVICHPGAHYSKQKLIEVVLNKRVVWLVTDSKLDWLQKDQHEWTNTKMIFELSPKVNKTELQFMHEGLVPGMECFDRCTEGWNMVIKDSLFNFITRDKAI